MTSRIYKLIKFIIVVITFMLIFKMNNFNHEIDASTSINDLEYDVTTVKSSGKDDSNSLVMVFVAEGFTKDEQDVYLDYLYFFKDQLKNEIPFSYFYDYITIYAVHTISNESGITGDDGNGNYDEKVKVDTFFKSYSYQRSSSANISTSTESRYLAQEIAQKVSSNVAMVEIVCNGSFGGGTSDGSGPNGKYKVALASIGYNSSNKYRFSNTTLHELGHSFCYLGDEYWNGFGYGQYGTNCSSSNDPNVVMWKHLIGYNGIGIYPFSTDPTNPASFYVRASQKCRMQHSEDPYCLACEDALITRIENNLGIKLYDTELLSDGTLKITKVNYQIYGSLNIQPVYNKIKVTEIGDNAFINQNQLTDICLPDAITKIGNNCFKNCQNLKSITLSKNIQNIGQYAFANCPSLADFSFVNDDIDFDQTIFDNCNLLNDVKIRCSFNHLYTKDNFQFTNCNAHLNLVVGPVKNSTFSDNIIYWDKVEVATKYRIDIYDKNELIFSDVTSNLEYDLSNLDISLFSLFNYTITALKDNCIEDYPYSSIERVKVHYIFGNNDLIYLKYYIKGYQAPKPEIGLIPGFTYSNWKVKNIYNEIVYLNSWNFETDIVTSDTILFCTLTACTHQYDDLLDTKCNLCGETRVINHDFVYKHSFDSHWLQCSICNVILTNSIEEHLVIDDHNCNTDDFCKCGYLLNMAKNHNLIYQPIDEHTHYEKCSNEGCEYKQESNHQFTVVKTDAVKKWFICDKCAFEDLNNTKFFFEQSSNATISSSCNNITIIFQIICLNLSSLLFIFMCKKH